MVGTSSWRLAAVVLAGALSLAACSGSDSLDASPTTGEVTTAAGASSLDVSTTSGEAADQAEQIVGGTRTSTSATTTTTTTTTTEVSSTTAAPEVVECNLATIADQLGADASLVDNACQEGWALVDLCGNTVDEPCGDSWVLAQYQGDVWTSITGFPTIMCRSDLEAMGAPNEVLDVVAWGTCEQPTTTRPGSDIMARFVAAWNARDWDGMAAIAEPGVVQVAQEWTTPEGEALPPPPFASCFALEPEARICETLYDAGQGGFAFIFSLRVIEDRVLEMSPAGDAG